MPLDSGGKFAKLNFETTFCLSNQLIIAINKIWNVEGLILG